MIPNHRHVHGHRAVAMEIAMPKTKPKNPAFLDTARAFYADAFEHHRKKDIVTAIEAWSEMDGGEQSYAVAHLLYLNVQAQASTVRLLTDVRDLLDEVAEGIDAALDDDEEDDVPPEASARAPSIVDADPDRGRVDESTVPVTETTAATPSEVA